MFGASKKLLICWILLSSPLVLYGQTPTPGELADKPKQQNAAPQKKPTPDKRGTEQSPLVIKILPAPASEVPTNDAAHEKHDEPEKRWWDSQEWWLDHIVEILLAVATFLLWLATRSLVNGAEDTARRQLRAYISMTGGEPVEAVDGAQHFGFQVHFKNAGQTPAYDVVSGARCTLMDLPRTIPLPDVPLTEKSRSTFGPGIGSSLFPTFKLLTPDQKTAIHNRKSAIYIHGRIEYLDAFKKRHTTHFNMIYRMTNSGRYIVGNDKDGNDAD